MKLKRLIQNGNVLYYFMLCHISCSICYAMLNPNYSEDVFFKGVGLWVISPILITATLFFIVVALSFGLLFEFGKYIKRKL